MTIYERWAEGISQDNDIAACPGYLCQQKSFHIKNYLGLGR